MARKHQVTAATMAIIMGLLAKFEGYNAAVYLDVVGIPSVCTGHTGADVHLGDVWDKAKCMTALYSDTHEAINGIDRLIDVDLSAKTMASLVSFTYNVGVGALEKSSIRTAFNQGRMKDGCNNMRKYVYAKGYVINGLVTRRNAEANLCLEGLE